MKNSEKIQNDFTCRSVPIYTLYEVSKKFNKKEIIYFLILVLRGQISFIIFRERRRKIDPFLNPQNLCILLRKKFSIFNFQSSSEIHQERVVLKLKIA